MEFSSEQEHKVNISVGALVLVTVWERSYPTVESFPFSLTPVVYTGQEVKKNLANGIQMA